MSAAEVAELLGVMDAMRGADRPQESLNKRERAARRLMTEIAGDILESATLAQATHRLERILMHRDLYSQLATLDALVDIEPRSDVAPTELGPSTRDAFGARAGERLLEGCRDAQRLMALISLFRTFPRFETKPNPTPSTSTYPQHLEAISEVPPLGPYAASIFRGMIAICAIVAATWTQRTLQQDIAMFIADTFATGVRDWCRLLAACIRPEYLPEALIPTADRFDIEELVRADERQWAEMEARLDRGEEPSSAPRQG